jgi:hypothetical protein
MIVAHIHQGTKLMSCSTHCSKSPIAAPMLLPLLLVLITLHRLYHPVRLQNSNFATSSCHYVFTTSQRLILPLLGTRGTKLLPCAYGVLNMGFKARKSPPVLLNTATGSAGTRAVFIGRNCSSQDILDRECF